MDIRVIGDKDTVVGFRLAGIGKGYAVNDGKEAEEAFEKCAESGIVIITERFAEMIRGALSRERLFPLVVEVPDKAGKMDREDQLRVLMRKAIGVDIKNKENEK